MQSIISYFKIFGHSLFQERPTLRQCVNAFLAILTCLLLCYALLFAVGALLPLGSYKNNILEAHDKGYFKENYPQVTIIVKPSKVDMWTECGGIGMAMREHKGIDDLFLTKRYGNCNELSAAAYGDFSTAPQTDYFRYTHGYALFVRILYTYFDLQTVRTICTGISCLLLLALWFALKNQVSTAVASLVVGSFFLLNSASMYVLVVHAVQFWLVLVASIIATFMRSKQAFFLLMALVGTFDAFFSILSMGSLSLSMPLLCYLLSAWAKFTATNEQTEECNALAQGFWACVAWSIGFLLPWFTKWGILYFVYDVSTQAILGNTVESYATQGIGMILLALFKNFLATHIALWIPLFALLWWIRIKEGRTLPKGLWISIFPALIPIIWCSLLPGQSGIKHSSFVNLILWPVFCLCCFYVFTPERKARFKDLLPMNLRKL